MNRIKPLGILVTALALAALPVAATSAESLRETALSPPAPKQPSPPPSKPYNRRSLTDLSDTELLRLMTERGRTAQDFESAAIVRNHVPPDFWTMDPKAAALAVAEMNRSPEHRARYELSVDDHSPDLPPASCTLALTNASARCYNAVDAHYFLRVDPKGSYLAYGRSSSGGVVFYSIVFDQPAFDLRFCPLSYEDARHLAATIYWLDRLHSRNSGRDSVRWMNYSSADGHATLSLRNGEGALLFDHQNTRWSDSLSERWTGNYDHEAFVNFATYLVKDVLTERLGTTWIDAKPTHSQNNLLRQDRGPLYTEEEIRHFTKLTNRFLAGFSSTQDQFSLPLVTCAAEAAGTLAMPEAKPLLEILAKQTAEGSTDNRLVHLRQVALTALRKIETANDSSALYTWAIAKEPGSQWALQRLSLLDQPRYAQALETWMSTSEVKAEGVRQIFQELQRVAPARATAIAAALPPEKQSALTVAAFSLLQKTGQLTDEAERLNALLAVALNPKGGWERVEAINLLVPTEDPFRYPQRDVDNALLRMLDPDMADPIINFTSAWACQGLARRQRIETFDRMTQLLGSTKDSMTYDRILEAVVLLARSDPARFNPRLTEIIAPQLKATNKAMTGILWAIWMADLRNLLPELERLGTADPEDYEDNKASSSGGEITPVLGRFHLARKIADVWNATDPVTQIRLLTAFAMVTPYDYVEGSPPERGSPLAAALRQSAQTLTPLQRQRLEEFFQAVIQQPERDDLPTQKRRQHIVTLAIAAIAPSPQVNP
jgi:hypothetical protein